MCSTCKSTGDEIAETSDEKQASASSSLTIADDNLDDFAASEEKQEGVLQSRRKGVGIKTLIHSVEKSKDRLLELITS